MTRVFSLAVVDCVVPYAAPYEVFDISDSAECEQLTEEPEPWWCSRISAAEFYKTSTLVTLVTLVNLRMGPMQKRGHG